MEKEQAFKIWEKIFGDKDVAYDYASHPMKKEDFQKEDSYYSWDIDKKQPYLVRDDNYIPSSLNTISFRNGKSTFKVGNNLFEVRKGKVYGTFSIYDITDRNHPLNMDPTEENQDPEFNKKRFHEIATSYHGASKDPRFLVPTMSSIEKHVFDDNLSDVVVPDSFYEDDSEENEENDEESEEVDEEYEEESDEETESEEDVEDYDESSMDENEEESEESVEEDNAEELEDAEEVIDTDSEEENMDSDNYKNEFQKLNQHILMENDEEDDLEYLARENDLYRSDEQIKEELPPLVIELQNKNQEKDKKIEDLNQEINRLKEHENDFAALLSSNEALKERINSLTLEIEEKQNSLNEIKTEKESIESELNLIKTTNEELSMEINNQQNQFNEINQKNIELSQQIQNFSSIKEEKDQLLNRYNDLLYHEQNLKNDFDALKEEKDKLEANYNQLDAQTELIDGQIASLNSENQDLTKRLSAVNERYEKTKKENENLILERDFYREKIKDKNKTEEVVNTLEEKLKTTEEELARKNARIEVLNASVAQLESKGLNDAQKYENINSEKQNQATLIEELQTEKIENQNLILFLSLGGTTQHYQEIRQDLMEKALPFDQEHILHELEEHPEWRIEEVHTVNAIRGHATAVLQENLLELNERNQRKEKAMNFYHEIYGEEKSEVSDFAGRFIRLSDYGDKNSEYGWDYALLDPADIEVKDNVFIAHYRSIKDYRFRDKFMSNGHKYEVVKEDGKYKIKSSDFITDPYDFTQALRVTRTNIENKTPLVYLFVKAVGINTSDPDQSALMELFDLFDRTVKRCCPISFVEMKTVVGIGKGNYAFITFDGNQSEVYREVLDYAVLINSYRKEYRKENRLNAVIVLNEVDVPFSKRHLDYDALVTETKDDELRALRYEFNMSVINSLIKRSLHIGPKILDKLPLDQNLLKPSQIGVGNYAQLFKFNREFKVYNFVYALSYKEESQE